jgi:hypothetical protein
MIVKMCFILITANGSLCKNPVSRPRLGPYKAYTAHLKKE